MAMKGLLKGLTGRSADADHPGAPAATKSHPDPALRLQILDEFERAGIAWVWATDAEGRLVYLSDKAQASLGDQAEGILGQQLEIVFEADAEHPGEGSGRSLRFLIKARQKVRDQVVRIALGVPRQAARQTWWVLSGHPVFDASGQFAGYRGGARDVTAEYERKLADSRLADFDSLTGLANRHSIDRQLDATLAAFRGAGRPCALMMLDLDKFKRVNDTLGHQAGDALLVQVAERLTGIVGRQGAVARLGGDEFQIMLPDRDDRGALGELAQKVIHILSQPYALDDKRAVIGTSVGIAVAPFDGDAREDLVRSADLALYTAKNGGRGQYRFYTSDLKNEEQERDALLDDLRAALEAGQLELHYQPVVAVETGHVACLEALMRWEHPERGFVSPAQFIPAAEESDLILALGEWALRSACEAAMRWPENVRVAVNVSAVQFASAGFPAVVASVLAHTGLAADRLELELTESIFVGDTDETERMFRSLKDLGVRLALDDFGTGYSSLSYLRAAPFDKIKVDKSFVDSCTQKDKNSAKIIAAIVGLSNALNMETTVEGVEAFDQLEVVKARGARFVQGYIYSRPLPEAALMDLIASGKLTIEPSGPEVYRPDRRSVYRRVGVIHEDYYYNAVMRDLSRNGAGLEGVLGLEENTQLVLDLGDGQLAVCTVARVDGQEFAVEFETPLVDDGAGGLCTRHRVSRYTIVAAGLPEKPGTAGPTEGRRDQSTPRFFEVAPGTARAA